MKYSKEFEDWVFRTAWPWPCPDALTNRQIEEFAWKAWKAGRRKLRKEYKRKEAL